jgi:hypothetical protein
MEAGNLVGNSTESSTSPTGFRHRYPPAHLDHTGPRDTAGLGGPRAFESLTRLGTKGFNLRYQLLGGGGLLDGPPQGLQVH